MNTSSLLDAYLEGGPQGGGGVSMHDRSHRSSVEEAYNAAAEDAVHHDGYEDPDAYHPPRAESAPAGRPTGHMGTPFAEIQNQPQYAGFQAGPQQAYQGKHSSYTPGRRQQQPMGIFRAMREADARRSVEPRRPPMEPYTIPLDASNAEVRNIAADTALRARLHQIRTDLEARSYRQQLLEQLQQHQAIFNGRSSGSPRHGVDVPVPRPGSVAPRPNTSPASHSAAAAAGRIPPATAHGYAGRTSLEDYLQQYGGQGHSSAAAEAAPTWLGSGPQPYHVSSYPAAQQQQQQQERPWSLPTTLQQYLDAANTTTSSSNSRGTQPYPHLQRLLDNAPLLPFQKQAQQQRSRPKGMASPFANPALQQSDGQAQEQHLDGRFTSNSSTVAVMALKASLEELKQLRGRLQATAAAANSSSSSAVPPRVGRAAAAGVRPWPGGAAGHHLRRPHTSAGVLGPGYGYGHAAAAGWQVPRPQPGTWAAAAPPSSLWQQQPTGAAVAAAAVGGAAIGAPTWDVWADTPWEKRMKEALHQQRRPGQGFQTGRPHTAAPALFTQHPGATGSSRGQQRAQSAPRGASLGPPAAAGGVRPRLFGSPVKLYGQQGAGLGRQQQAARGAPAGGWLQGSPIRRMAARSPGRGAGAAAGGAGGAAGVQQRSGPSEAALAAAAAELGASFAQRSRYGAGSSSRYGASAPGKAMPAWGSRSAQQRPSSGGSSSSDEDSSSCSEAGGRRQQPGLGRGLAAVDMVLQQARGTR